MQSIIRENNQTLKLAFPIACGLLSHLLMGLIDTLMIGHLGTVELAAAAFSNVLHHFPFVMGFGLYSSVAVMVSHAHGSQNNGQATEAFRNGYLLALIFGLTMAVALIACIPFLHLFQQPAEVIEIVPEYLFWLALSLVPTFPMMTIKKFAEAQNQPWSVFWIMLCSVLLNIGLNYALIFGQLGAPQLGLAGAGIATLLARLASWAGLYFYLQKSSRLSATRPLKYIGPWNRSACQRTLRLAAPISGQLVMEYGAFAMAALLIGQFGSAALAAHQITLSCASFTFMIPLGISMAVTIRVGQALGSNDLASCKQIALGGHLSTLVVMVFCALVFVFGGDWIASAFSRDPDVVLLATALLGIAAAFQVFDGIQIISMGALRGLRDVNLPTLIIFVSFWLVGIPLGAGLAFFADMQTSGLWSGLASGLALAAAILSLRLMQKLRELKDV
ncbi:MAG: MATE family efflux transporter [Verrucomicrobiota bacterium]